MQHSVHRLFEYLGRARWRRYLLRLGMLGLLWFGMNGSDGKSWIVGAPTVMLAAAINFPFLPRGAWRFRLGGLLPMVWFFIKQSYLGAFDVARRALAPSLPINPGFLDYRCRLSSASARLFFADMITLMPGTLSARADDANILIHTLDVTGEVASSLRALEERVAALFGARLENGSEVQS